MNQKSTVQFRQLLMIAIGAFLYALGLQYFVVPYSLMEGGVTGIAVLLNYIFKLPLSITTLVINIPLFLIGWKVLGGKKMLLTIYGSVMLSAFLALIEFSQKQGWIAPLGDHYDAILVVLYAGLTLGAGLGIVFRYGGTTGGVDIVARIINKNRGHSMGQTILIFDILIIGASIVHIHFDKILYTLVMVFISSKVIDFIQNGAYSGKAFSIISEHGEEIADRICEELERGVTLYPAQGAYSGRDKKVVYCVVSRAETHRMKQIIKSIDPRAFIVISDVQDVLGEGFKEDE